MFIFQDALIGNLKLIAETLPKDIQAVYRLDVNEFRGQRTVQLILQHWEAV